MSNQDKFESAARTIVERNQAAMDLKIFLSHWGGYEEVRNRHKKEILELAQSYDVEIDLKKWKLNGHWM